MLSFGVAKELGYTVKNSMNGSAWKSYSAGLATSQSSTSSRKQK